MGEKGERGRVRQAIDNAVVIAASEIRTVNTPSNDPNAVGFDPKLIEQYIAEQQQGQ